MPVKNHHLSGSAGFKPHHRGHPGLGPRNLGQGQTVPHRLFLPVPQDSPPGKREGPGQDRRHPQNSLRSGYDLIAKGAVIEKPDPGVQIYPKLTILDESGLVIIARQVPNLYYQYRGKTGINPNIYIIIKNVG